MAVKIDMESIATVGRIVQFHRKQAGLSRIALADIAGVGKTIVYDIEKGKQTRGASASPEDRPARSFQPVTGRGNGVELTPAYDILNSTIVLAAPKEEIALTVQEKKRKLDAGILIKNGPSFAILWTHVKSNKGLVDNFSKCTKLYAPIEKIGKGHGRLYFYG